MADRVTLNVSLTPELSQFVSGRVESGRYLSASEVVREGLRLLVQQEESRSAVLARLNQKLQEGLDSLARGEGVPGEQVFEELDREIEALRTR